MRPCLLAAFSFLANGLVAPPNKKQFQAIQNRVLYIADPQPTDLDAEFVKLDFSRWNDDVGRETYDEGGPDFMWVKRLKDYPDVRVAGYPTQRYHDAVTQRISRHKAWDPDVVNALCEAFKVHQEGHFLDVGGNIGAYTIPLASCLEKISNDRHVVTVEMSPENAHHLVVGLFVSNLTNVHLYQYAVSGLIPQDYIAIIENRQNQGMLQADENVDADPMRTLSQVTTLDSIMKHEVESKSKHKGKHTSKNSKTTKNNGRILAMKIDIEGHEVKALRGFQDFMSKSPPCILVAELVHSTQELQDLIAQSGFVHKWSAVDGMNSWFEQADMEGCLAKLNMQ